MNRQVKNESQAVQEFNYILTRGNIIPNRNIINYSNCLILKFHNIINRAMIIITPQYGSICYMRIYERVPVVHINKGFFRQKLLYFNHNINVLTYLGTRVLNVVTPT